jgi:hypothetical protein
VNPLGIHLNGPAVSSTNNATTAYKEEFPDNLFDIALGTLALSLLTAGAILFGSYGQWSAFVLVLLLLFALAPLTVYAFRGEREKP